MKGFSALAAAGQAQYEFIYEILQHETAVNFSASLLENSYKSCFPDYVSDVPVLLDRAWGRLLDARDGFELYEACGEVHRHLFKTEDPESWFGRGYSTYKSRSKPMQDFKNLAKAIKGKRVLDFGTGRGHLAVLIARAGFDCHTADVMDFRGPDAQALPFRQITSPSDVPYADDMFDSAIVKTVLHHVNAPDLTPLLMNLRRVAQRLIIEEDTYAVPVESLGPLVKQAEIDKFHKLDDRDQFRVLTIIDLFGNAVAQGLVDMNFGCQFKRVSEWHSLFRSLGFHVSETQILGFQPGAIHQSCQVRFVVDRVDS
jgi:SAM-dependent methyltransferase